MSDGDLALTLGLVSRVHRIVEDSGPLPGLVYHTDKDYVSLSRPLFNAGGRNLAMIEEPAKRPSTSSMIFPTCTSNMCEKSRQASRRPSGAASDHRTTSS